MVTKKVNNFTYEFDSFLDIVKKTSLIDYIMTQNVNCYEEIENPAIFCSNRKITFLPSKDHIHKFVFDGKEFHKEIIENSDKTTVGTFIFDLDFMERFAEDSQVRDERKKEEVNTFDQNTNLSNKQSITRKGLNTSLK
jgi:hypothetical protein